MQIQLHFYWKLKFSTSRDSVTAHSGQTSGILRTELQRVTLGPNKGKKNPPLVPEETGEVGESEAALNSEWPSKLKEPISWKSSWVGAGLKTQRS